MGVGFRCLRMPLLVMVLVGKGLKVRGLKD